MTEQKILENLKRKCAVAKQEYEALNNAVELLEKEISLLKEEEPHYTTFAHKTTAAYVYEYLKKVNIPCSLEEITDALKEIGVESTAKNFKNTVKTNLYRRKEFTRLENGMWKLTENS